MKKLLLIFAIAFGFIGFSGAGYVIYTGGEANPGYGIIPMLFCIICVNFSIFGGNLSICWAFFRNIINICKKCFPFCYKFVIIYKVICRILRVHTQTISIEFLNS